MHWTLLALVLLAGCGSNLRRDSEVQASVPRALGLGSFAPTCLAFCVVNVRFQQGDTFEGDPEKSDVRAKTEEELKSHIRIGKPQ